MEQIVLKIQTKARYDGLYLSQGLRARQEDYLELEANLGKFQAS